MIALQAQLTQKVQQQIYTATELKVRLSVDDKIVSDKLNDMNPKIDQLVNGSDGHLGYTQLSNNIKKAQANQAKCAAGAAGDCPTAAQITDWQNQLNNINQKLCGTGYFPAGSGTFSSKTGAGSCVESPLSSALPNDPTSKGYVQTRDALMTQQSDDEKNLVLLDSNYLNPSNWNSNSSQIAFASDLNYTRDLTYQSKGKNDSAPIISIQSAKDKLTSQMMANTTTVQPAAGQHKSSGSASLTSNASQLQQAATNIGSPSSGASLNSAGIQQDEVAHTQLMQQVDLLLNKVIVQPSYSNAVDARNAAQQNVNNIQMAPYLNQGAASAYKRTQDTLAELKRTKDLELQVLANINKVNNVKTTIPACTGSVMTGDACANQESPATQAIATLYCKNNDQTCIGNWSQLISSPNLPAGFNRDLYLASEEKRTCNSVWIFSTVT